MRCLILVCNCSTVWGKGVGRGVGVVVVFADGEGNAPDGGVVAGDGEVTILGLGVSVGAA